MNPTRPKYIWSCEKNLIRSFNFNACFDIVTYNNDVVHLTIHTRTVIRIHNYTILRVSMDSLVLEHIMVQDCMYYFVSICLSHNYHYSRTSIIQTPWFQKQAG